MLENNKFESTYPSDRRPKDSEDREEINDTGVTQEDKKETFKEKFKKDGWKTLFLPLILLVTKGKTILLLLSKVKFLGAGLSMIISVGAYTLLWGLPFAAGFVALIFVHEMGHVFQLKREGIKASAPMFIPFLGAAISMKEMPKNAPAEARVALAGPILGSLGCLIPLLAYFLTGNLLWLALAYTGFLINLFNLVPISPLDGGRAMAAVSPFMWAIGVIAMVILLVFLFNPILLLITVLALLATFSRYKEYKEGKNKEYYQTSFKVKLITFSVYTALVIVLGLATEITYHQVEEGLQTENNEPTVIAYTK